MQITGDWLTSKDTQAVLRMLVNAGYQAYCVGGCVRNALMNEPIADVDIATDALPDQVIRLAVAAGLKPIATGLDHGTITVISNSIPFEVTTFRKDVETDGRHAVVAFSDNLHDDAVRRDFTVNALYVAMDGTVIDPLGGLPDVTARRIRFIEDAERRIKEDYLRILRFFRFTAWYADPAAGMDADGLAACAAHIDGIASLSKERVGAEMKKLLAAPDPAPALAAMGASGVLAQILPGADAQYVTPLVHLEAGIPPRWQRRLAVMTAAKVTKELRLSRAEERYLWKTRNAMQSGESAKVNAYKFGADAALDAKLIEAATLTTLLSPTLRSEITEGSAAVFPLSGADLMPKIAAGPELGHALKLLEKRWIDSGFILSKDQLLNG